MLPPEADSAKGSSVGHPAVGRVFLDTGVSTVYMLPPDDAPANGLSTDSIEGPQSLHGRWLDNLRHMLPQESSNLKDFGLGVVDFTLYNETFTGRVKSIPRCRHCLSEHHQSQECNYAPDSSPGVQRGLARPSKSSTIICQLFQWETWQ